MIRASDPQICPTSDAQRREREERADGVFAELAGADTPATPPAFTGLQLAAHAGIAEPSPLGGFAPLRLRRAGISDAKEGKGHTLAALCRRDARALRRHCPRARDGMASPTAEELRGSTAPSPQAGTKHADFSEESGCSYPHRPRRKRSIALQHLGWTTTAPRDPATPMERIDAESRGAPRG